MDLKEFNQLTAKPELMVYDNNTLEFYAEPYMLRLKFNEQIVNTNNQQQPNDLLWSQNSYLCRLKKLNYKQIFSGFGTEKEAKNLIACSKVEKFENEGEEEEKKQQTKMVNSSSSDDEESDSEHSDDSREDAKFMFGFGMKYKNLIPSSFFDKTGSSPLTLQINPDKAEPMKRMVIKYETEM